MILPIVAYGHPVLKKIAKPITQDYPDLEKLLANMWETMYNGNGVGLAAPQIGLDIRLFLVDSAQLIDPEEEPDPKLKKGIKQVFINPEIIEESGEPWIYEEGCLSIPDVRVKISRNPTLRIKYLDEHFKEHLKAFDGMNARIIQHEYDHIEGILLTDHMSPLKKNLVKKKLENISTGKVSVKYRMKFAK